MEDIRMTAPIIRTIMLFAEKPRLMRLEEEICEQANVQSHILFA
jgi:hypothetical protein